jgi:hypothetical protein
MPGCVAFVCCVLRLQICFSLARLFFRRRRRRRRHAQTQENLSVAAQQQAVMAKSSSIFAAKSAHMYTFASHTRD